MKLSYQWLSDYIQAIPEPEKLSEILTNLGLEVEDVFPYSSVPGNLEGLVVGYTLSVIQHPNADRLRICSVDIGVPTPLSIVCGAPNVASGQKVIVAPVGTMVYPVSGEPFLIQKSKIRGEFSEGMLCAEDEIGLGTSHEGIKILPSDWEIGKTLKSYFNPYQDQVFEIGITPNRSDALSHRGSARDVLAFLHTLPGLKPLELSRNSFEIPKNSGPFQVQIDNPENCFRFSGIHISGIQIKESPDWLKNRLNAIGVRPINNIVDITNFILHDLGQPLHAYDTNKIKGSRLIARNAREGETLVTLDGQTRNLIPQDLVIADIEKPLGIAGVFGGEGSGIQDKTTSIFLEAACFNPVCVRITSRRLALKTDASFRFERGTDPEATLEALYKASKMVLELAGGELSSDFLDIYPKTIPRPKVHLRSARINSLIGQEIEPNRVEQILSGLGITILENKEGAWDLEIPLFKTDVTREADVIEEILRVYGFNQIHIPGQIRSSINPSLKPDPEKIQEETANFLSARGFNEMVSSSLVNGTYSEIITSPKGETPVMVLHPLSQDTNMLRNSMIPSLLKAVEHNLNRKQLDIRFYEFGKVYGHTDSDYTEKSKLALVLSGKEEQENWFHLGQEPMNLYTLKGNLEGLFSRLGLVPVFKQALENEWLKQGLEILSQNRRIGYLGTLKGGILKPFNLDKDVFYAELDWDAILDLKKPTPFITREIPKFPRVQRDLSLLLPKEVRFDQLQELVKKAKIQILDDMNIFDVYEGNRIPEGKKSYSLRFYLQDESQTLTDQEIDKAMKKLMDLFQKEVHAEIPLTS